MPRPFDMSKFRKGLTKNITGISTGFFDPQIWIDTGNKCLNYLISGDFNKGVPLSKVTVFAGESGAGKSYICSGNLVRNAQEQGIFVVLLDAENALDEDWLHNLGVDTSEEKLLRINVSQVDHISRIINDFMDDYKGTYAECQRDSLPVLFVIDSLGMLTTPSEAEQFKDGNMKGDMGRKAKALMALVRGLVPLIAPYNVGVVATNHTYASQDMYNPDDKVAGGAGFVYASSILVTMRKKKLKEDDEGNKIKEVKGIKAICKVEKTRFNKPFESVEINIPYNGGMNPNSGIFDFFKKNNVLTQTGAWYSYVSKKTGQEYKLLRKNMDQDFYDMLMSEYIEYTHSVIPNENDMLDDDNDVEILMEGSSDA